MGRGRPRPRVEPLVCSRSVPHLDPLPAPSGYVFTVVSTCVAAAILAAVEGGILPPGMASLGEELTAKPARISAGQDARLYGRQDACRYSKHVPERGEEIWNAPFSDLCSVTRTRCHRCFPSPFLKGRGSGFLSTAWMRLREHLNSASFCGDEPSPPLLVRFLERTRIPN